MNALPPREGVGHTEGWRGHLYRVIFEHNTPAGRAFDVALLAAIALSVAAVMLESVPEVRRRHGPALVAAEWAFTVLFTAEYFLRLLCVRRPARYALSFYGIVDMLAVVPTYAALFVTGAQELLVIRALRLLRVFRVLQMGEYLVEAGVLKDALRRSRPKITVFLVTVLTLVLIVGAVMHLVEGPENGFTSIPRVLGHRHPHDGRLRRHRPAYRGRAAAGLRGHDRGLWDHRRADGHRHGRARAGRAGPRGPQAAAGPARLPGLRGRGA